MLALLEGFSASGPMWLFAPLGALLIIPRPDRAEPVIQAAGPRAQRSLAEALALPAWQRRRWPLLTRPIASEVHDRACDLHPDSRQAYWSVVNDRATLPAEYRRIAKWTYGKFPYSDRRRWITRAPQSAGTVPWSSSSRTSKARVNGRLRPAFGPMERFASFWSRRRGGHPLRGRRDSSARSTGRSRSRNIDGLLRRSYDGFVLTIVTGRRQR